MEMSVAQAVQKDEDNVGVWWEDSKLEENYLLEKLLLELAYYKLDSISILKYLYNVIRGTEMIVHMQN